MMAVMSAAMVATATLFATRRSLAFQSGTAIGLRVTLGTEISIRALTTVMMMATMSTTMMATATFFAAWRGLAFQPGATIHLSTDLSIGVHWTLAAVVMMGVMSATMVANAALFAARRSLTLQSGPAIDLSVGLGISAILMVPFAIAAMMTMMVAASVVTFLSTRFILLSLSFQPGLAVGVHIGLAVDSDLSISILSLVMTMMVAAAMMAFLSFLLARFILSLSFQQTFNYWIFLL